MSDLNLRTIFPISKARVGPSLFFFPDQGGTSFYAKKLVAKIDSEFACYGIKFDPKLLERFSTLQDTARSIAIDLRASNMSEPLHLIGHSFSGLLAYETACQLLSLGSRVGLLVLLDTRLPRRLYSSRLYFRAVEIARAIRYRQYKLAKQVLLGIHDSNSIRNLLSRLDLSKYPASYRSTLEQLIGARIDYKPGSYTGDITLIKASNFSNGILYPKYLGWEYFAKGKIDLFRVRCAHMEMVTSDRATKQVAQHLLRLLKKPE